MLVDVTTRMSVSVTVGSAASTTMVVVSVTLVVVAAAVADAAPGDVIAVPPPPPPPLPPSILTTEYVALACRLCLGEKGRHEALVVKSAATTTRDTGI